MQHDARCTMMVSVQVMMPMIGSMFASSNMSSISLDVTWYDLDLNEGLCSRHDADDIDDDDPRMISSDG